MSAPVVPPDDVARIVATKKAWEDRLLANPNVTGVDIDHKMVGGQYVDAPCIVVYVARKGLFAESERIPATLDGVRTDVVQASFQHVPGAGGSYDSDRYNPCKGGAMISPMRDATNYGTLGCLVTDRLNGDRKCWLGCYHVICGDSLWDAPGTDQRVVQPAKFTGAGEGDVIGFIVRGKYGRASAPNSPGVYIDAALVSISGRMTSTDILGLPGDTDGMVNIILGTSVQKYGAKTGSTAGTIRSDNFTMNFYDALGRRSTFYNQLKIMGQTGQFCDGGDSGAVVFEQQDDPDHPNRYSALGMIIGQGGAAYCVATPMESIAAGLNIWF